MSLSALKTTAASQGLSSIVLAIENGLNSLLGDKKILDILKPLENYLNTLLGVTGATDNTHLQMIRSAESRVLSAASGFPPLVQAIIKMLMNLIGGMQGNPAMLQALIAYIMQLITNAQPKAAEAEGDDQEPPKGKKADK